MKKLLVSGWVEVAFRLILGLTFVAASAHKIYDPGRFAHIIYGYQIMPGWSLNLLAIFLPWVEIISGLALLAGCKTRGATSLISGMLFVYICALSFNLARGLQFDCGCFSFNHDPQVSVLQLIIRDLLQLALSLWLFFSPRIYYKWSWREGVPAAGPG